MNSLASSQLTLVTGSSPRLQAGSGGLYLHPPAATHLSHSANVTSRRPMAKAFLLAPLWNGASAGFSFEPIGNSPAGTTTSSTQSGQSRNVSPGKRASPDSAAQAVPTTQSATAAPATPAAAFDKQRSNPR